MITIKEFHLKKSVRQQLLTHDSWFKKQGDVIISNQQVALKLAEALRPLNKNIQASELNALGLLHEIEHAMVEFYQKHILKNVLLQLERHFRQKLGSKSYQKLLECFCEYYPPTPVLKNDMSIKAYLKAQSGQTPNSQLILEEIFLLWLDHLNPAFKPLKKAMEPTELSSATVFEKTLDLFDHFFAQAPPLPQERASLFEFLREPAKKFPHSIQAQLGYIARHWEKYIGSFLKRLLFSLDFLTEEHKARFNQAAFGPGPSVVPQYSADLEPEHFTPDEHWMPRLVLIAKSTYVWLDQLSKKFERPITTLDQVPDEELERLSRFGITGLWLIGIWERSKASQRIKQQTGNTEALASAYSLYDYVVAQDLGGEAALQNLKERAWRFGIRMATDMVPNHTGIDSRWIIEHPDWFIQLPYSPFPKYSFNGPDLCEHNDVGIFIEDGYWDKTDAAVVFKRVYYPAGEVRYIYHGNDGTSMPWNDTAQLNYLNPEVREAVIQKIIDIARQFPIIRFDAAMTLTKKHFQRLWFPEPGHGGDIPSRAQFGMTKSEFDRHMPKEFWREVVDRVQKEAPDTLLLAEAFWLMEGYFVRTLGMHRVYNSAFMNMLKNEENDKFRLLIKKTLEFNPQILKRYVNFMNNPDEETAVVQFGKGDKYFGVCIMLATLPGLPMFGHGQIEGFAEKYGMEYRRAYWDEEEDSWLVQEHFRLIAPLLKKRYLFSDVENFLLYDLYNDDGQVNENVFAYSNYFHEERALVLYNNSFSHAAGWINLSAAFKTNEQLIQKPLWEGLKLHFPEDALIVFRDHISGLYYIREMKELKERGLFVDLGAYKFQVYLDFRPVFDSTHEPYRQLCQHLNGQGVMDLNIALKKMLYRPLHQAIEQALDPQFLRPFHEGFKNSSSTALFNKWFRENLTAFVANIAQLEQKESFSTPVIHHVAAQLTHYFKISDSRFFSDHKLDLESFSERLTSFFKLDTQNPSVDFRLFQCHLIYYLLEAVYHQSEDHEIFQDRLLDNIFADYLDHLDHLKFVGQRGLFLLDLLNQFPEGLAFSQTARLKEQIRYLFDLQAAARFIKLHEFNGVLYFNKENFEELLFWLFILHLLKKCKTPQKDCARTKRSVNNLNALIHKAFKSGYQTEKFLEVFTVKQKSSKK
ncbi:alpha-amylase family glycosyl hydrolase [Caldithrix abyssi]